MFDVHNLLKTAWNLDIHVWINITNVIIIIICNLFPLEDNHNHVVILQYWLQIHKYVYTYFH